MSRFEPARRLRIAVWTAAALAWGTTAAIAAQRSADNAGGEATNEQVDTASIGSLIEPTMRASIPVQPSAGLVVIRFQPSADEKAEVRTIYVPAATPEAPTPARAQKPTAAPTPRSGGS